MDREEALDALRELKDRIEATQIRAKHIDDRMPLDVQARSLNWQHDVRRMQGEYRSLLLKVTEQAVLTPEELAELDLPEGMA